MGKRDVTDITEKQSQNKDAAFKNRHASFKRSEVTKTETTEKQAEKVAERKRPGSGDIPDARILSKAGEEPFRNDLTRAGHSFQEHGNRTSGIWEKPKGNPEELSKRGQDNLDHIINAKDTQWVARHHVRFGNIVEGRLPDGRGARWSADGKKFHGFLDPDKESTH